MAAFAIHDLRSPVQDEVGNRTDPSPPAPAAVRGKLDGYVVRADRQSGRARDAAVGTLAGMRKHWGKKTNVRVLVDEAGGIIDLVVDDHVQVLLGGMLAHIRVGEFLGVGHCGFFCLDLFPCLSCQDFSRTL